VQPPLDGNSVVLYHSEVKNGPYELVVAPATYPGVKYRNRYIYEHHLVWWLSTGKLVPPGFVLHHKNENKRDNTATNLELKSNGSHTAKHNAERREPPVCVECHWCGTAFVIEARNHRWKRKAGQVFFYCCRSHQVSQQQKDRRAKLVT
jgi:hypothetical protein